VLLSAPAGADGKGAKILMFDFDSAQKITVRLARRLRLARHG
jgi:hypothetical protein